MCGKCGLKRLHRPRSRELDGLGVRGLGNFISLGDSSPCAIVPRSLPPSPLLRSSRARDPVPLLGLRFRLLRLCAAAARDIFLAVDRRDMGRIPVEIGPPDSKILAVLVDPLPELFGGDPSLRAAVALDAHDVGRKPAAIAATGTAAMVGPIGCGLQAGCDRLTVVVAERAGDAGLQSGLFGGVKRVKQLQLETSGPCRRSHSPSSTCRLYRRPSGPSTQTPRRHAW